MFWILVAIVILGLVFAFRAVVQSIFNSANQVLEMIDNSPPPACPRENRNGEV